ncbi:hypothetical protein B9D06_22080, partial [Mycobacterium tuberculosis]
PGSTSTDSPSTSTSSWCRCTTSITAFVADAADLIPGRVLLTLYPDPYPGHLRARSGLDLDRLAEHVDEFVVPLYDLDHGVRRRRRRP